MDKFIRKFLGSDQSTGERSKHKKIDFLLRGDISDRDKKNYLRIFEQAMLQLEENQEVDFELMTLPGRESIALTTSLVYNERIDPDLYHAYNKYCRRAYEILFPSDDLLAHKDSPQFDELTDACKKLVYEAIKEHLSPDSMGVHAVDKYDLIVKRRSEPALDEKRLKPPLDFYAEVMKRIESNDVLCSRFFEYMAMLSLASYRILEKYTEEKKLPLISFELFIKYDGPISSEYNNFCLRSINQTRPTNHSNFATLLAVIVHADDKLKSIGVPLRQYFLDEDGKTQVAKCGFLDAFQDHIPNIVLAE